MKNVSLRSALGIGSAVICLLSASIVFAREDEQLAKQLLKVSGLERQIQELPSQITSGLETRKDKMASEQYKQLQNVLANAFKAEKLETIVLGQIQRNLDAATMKAVLGWLSSDLGSRITALEDEASGPSGVQGIKRFVGQLSTNPPPATRIALLQQLDLATHATETSVKILEGTTLSMLQAINATLPKNEQIPLEQLRQQIASQRAQLKELYSQSTMATMLYTYRSLNDADLQKYLAFADSPAGSRYHTVVQGALQTALQSGGQDMGKLLGEIMKQSRLNKTRL